MKRKIWKHSLPVVLGFFLVSMNPAIGQPSAYGKIVLSTSSGKVPLKDATVELRKKGEDDVLAKTYTDDKGNFALYDIEPGEYEMFVSINKKGFKQETGSKLVEKRIVKIKKGAPRIGEVVVSVE